MLLSLSFSNLLVWKHVKELVASLKDPALEFIAIESLCLVFDIIQTQAPQEFGNQRDNMKKVCPFGSKM